MSERPPTTMVRGSESETPHLRVEMPRDVYKRLARAERQVAAVREVLGWHQPLYGDEARDLHDAIRHALETE